MAGTIVQEIPLYSFNMPQNGRKSSGVRVVKSLRTQVNWEIRKSFLRLLLLVYFFLTMQWYFYSFIQVRLLRRRARNISWTSSSLCSSLPTPHFVPSSPPLITLQPPSFFSSLLSSTVTIALVSLKHSSFLFLSLSFLPLTGCRCNCSVCARCRTYISTPRWNNKSKEQVLLSC